MWNVILKVERTVVGTADTFKDAIRAMFEARLAGVECDVVKVVK